MLSWKNKVQFLLLVVFVAGIMSACGGATSPEPVQAPVMNPTHFVCYQQGVKVVDVVTDNGTTYRDITPKSHYVLRGWEWTVNGVKNSFSNSDSVSCSETPVNQ